MEEMDEEFGVSNLVEQEFAQSKKVGKSLYVCCWISTSTIFIYFFFLNHFNCLVRFVLELVEPRILKGGVVFRRLTVRGILKVSLSSTRWNPLKRARRSF